MYTVVRLKRGKEVNVVDTNQKQSEEGYILDRGRAPITFLVAQNAPQVVEPRDMLAEMLAEHDTKHPYTDDSDTV